MQHYLIYLLIYTNYVKTLLKCRQLCNQYLPPDLVWIEECSRVEVFKTLLCLEVDLSAEPNGQHVRLLTHQLLLSSAFLPSHRLSHSFFFLLFSPSYTHAHFHSFSLFIANSLFVEEEWEAYLPTIWWCQGRPEQMCSALGLCSIKHMHTHTHIHRGLHRACYRGRVH